MFIKKTTPFFANVNKYLRKQKILKKHKLQYGGNVININVIIINITSFSKSMFFFFKIIMTKIHSSKLRQ